LFKKNVNVLVKNENEEDKDILSTTQNTVYTYIVSAPWQRPAFSVPVADHEYLVILIIV